MKWVASYCWACRKINSSNTLQKKVKFKLNCCHRAIKAFSWHSTPHSHGCQTSHTGCDSNITDFCEFQTPLCSGNVLTAACFQTTFGRFGLFWYIKNSLYEKKCLSLAEGFAALNRYLLKLSAGDKRVIKTNRPQTHKFDSLCDAADQVKAMVDLGEACCYCLGCKAAIFHQRLQCFWFVSSKLPP